ncbi:MAG: radical SAM protein [Gammaproteobacteria bacterium]|nr:radical SAM protein [Gammaproteobacteria bacterium]
MDTIAYTLHGNCYLNITSRCTLRCRFCPKHNRNWVVQDYDLTLRHEPDREEILNALGDPARYHEVVFCGLGEPTQRLDVLLDVACAVKRQGGHVRVNTDGLANLIHGRDVTPELAECVDRVSISLNAQNADVYEQHTHPKIRNTYPAVLDFVRRARDSGMDVTVTAIDGLAGVDIAACHQIAGQLGVAFRRRLLNDVG